jgi:hypothetical protein
VKYVFKVMLACLVTISPFASTEYGSKFKVSELTPISKLISKSKELAEKEVIIKGMITNVCSYRGCWMEFASDKKYQSLRIKVRDGDMVFPITAKGKTAYAKGKISSKTFTKKQLISMAQKRAKGKNADISKITGPKTYYQFVPSGVRIE